MTSPQTDTAVAVALSGPRYHLDRRASKIAATVAASGDLDELLSTSVAADLLGVSEQWLEIKRCRGGGPIFWRLSTRRVRYSRRALLEFLAEREHASTAEYASCATGRKPGSRVVDGKVVGPEPADAA
jgi:hypothetical protein